MYRIGTRLQYRNFNFTLHQGGLGDLLGQLPAIKYVADKHPYIIINLWVHSYAVDLCKKIFNKYEQIKVLDLSKYKGTYNDDLPARSPYAHKIGNLSMHITNHAFLTIAGREIENEYKNYIKLDPIDITSFNLPEKYAVVTTGFTSPTRAWNAKSVKETTDYLVSCGYTPVYIGKSLTESFITETKNEVIIGNFQADYSNGINLIDKTDLFQAHSIIANSKVALGLDNGLVPHLAAMTDVPIIAAFTTVDPLHRLPYRNNILGYNCHTVTPTLEELRCRFCQSNMNFALPDHKFTTCFYGPNDYKCLDLITSNKFIEKLKLLGITNDRL